MFFAAVGMLGWVQPTAPGGRASQVSVRSAVPHLVSSVDAAFAAKASKASLMEGLRREYDSFFQPMEDELYIKDVSFEDPLISLSGLDAYRNNVNMLAGETALGKLCFTDCGLFMHNVTETADGGLQTRWTLQFRFKLLPWQPLARFTGVSQYTIDDQCRVVAQRDYWDSVNLLPGGVYAPQPKLAAFNDMLRQLSPRNAGRAQQSSEKELPYVLLRRAADKSGLLGYEVRRYPQHVSVATDYFRRLDAFGTLGAYTNGANELEAELTPYVPSLMSVPPTELSMEQVRDNSLDLKPSEAPKAMRWPMAVPSLKEGAPPQPNGRLDGVARLELMPTRVVAVLAFSEPTTEPVVRGYHALLKSYLDADGLVPTQPQDDEQFRLAQFDALNSFGARRSEIWVDLAEHPW